MTQKKQMTNPLGTDRISTLVARFCCSKHYRNACQRSLQYRRPVFYRKRSRHARKCCNQYRLSVLYALRFAGTAFWDRRSIKL